MSDPITSLHYAPNANIVNNIYAPELSGFNLADISSAGELPYLPAGVEALAWFGMTGGVTDAFKAAVNSYVGATNLSASTSRISPIRRPRPPPPTSRRKPIIFTRPCRA